MYRLLYVFLLISTLSFSQESITWQTLEDVSFSEKYFAEWDDVFLYPAFGDDLKSLEGKQVRLTGYFIDMDPEGEIFFISKNPMASCFFCGVGGPETAVEIQFDNKQGFETDDIVTFTGTLQLNADDVEHFNYIIEDATGVKIPD